MLYWYIIQSLFNLSTEQSLYTVELSPINKQNLYWVFMFCVSEYVQLQWCINEGGGGRVLLTVKIWQKVGKRRKILGKISGKRRKNWKRKAQIRKVLSHCPRYRQMYPVGYTTTGMYVFCRGLSPGLRVLGWGVTEIILVPKCPDMTQFLFYFVLFFWICRLRPQSSLSHMPLLVLLLTS